MNVRRLARFSVPFVIYAGMVWLHRWYFPDFPAPIILALSFLATLGSIIVVAEIIFFWVACE